MPYKIQFDRPPAGYALTHAREGESVDFQHIEFTSTEDGQHFIRRLEGFPDQIIRKLESESGISRSQVDHLLAIVRRDGSATVYVNELPQIVRIRIGRPIEKGEAVFKSDIVDIDRFQLGDISVPDDCGVAFLFSVGWRKGFFYDFGPLEENANSRSFDCEEVFGQLYAHVVFQERFSISDSEWEALTSAQLFPFCGLKNETIDQLIEYVRAGWDPNELVDRIVNEINERTELFLEAWAKHPIFQSHQSILERAVERFREADYLSCSALLYPRIEGIMRTNLNRAEGGHTSHQGKLVDAAVAAKLDNPKCLLLPHRFSEYLKRVYFANFDPNDQEIGVARHSVSHGTANADKFDAKAAAIGILVVQQLFFCCEQQ